MEYAIVGKGKKELDKDDTDYIIIYGKKVKIKELVKNG